ncbi:tyrosine-type recombinase/integrase [Saccharopolyspora sp. NPDC000995]
MSVAVHTVDDDISRADKGHAALPTGQEAREAAMTWWQTRASRSSVLERTLALPFTANSDANTRTRERGLVKLLDWLEDQPGETWQQRWLASGAEDIGRSWVQIPLEWLASQGRARKYDRIDVGSGMIPLLAGQVVRPGYRWLLRQQPAQLLGHIRRALDPDGFAALEAHCEATGRDGILDRRHAMNRIAWILTRKGGVIQDITIGDCVELQHAIQEHQAQGKGKHLFYALLAETGVFGPNAPMRLKAVMLPGQMTPAQLVDRHHVACRSVRDLLVDYLTERAAELDYTSLDALASNVVGLFWRDLERHHPGIESLRLDPEVAAAWKDRVRTIWDKNGRPLRTRVNTHSVFTYVRAFYQDLARWAAEDPARWASWVAPCPIRPADCGHSKARLRRKAEMDQRTRTLLPALPVLVDTVERLHEQAQRRLAAARDVPAGDIFTMDDEAFLRRAGTTDRVYVNATSTGKRRDLSGEEEDAFWTKVIVEVLKSTGIRIEEMLELTHHSFIAYRLPTTGEIVPMLQVAPSKLDQERLLLIAPELGEALTAIIHRVRGANSAIPLVSAYDTMERTWSAPMPFLFQRRHGAENRAISRNYIHKCLRAAVTASGPTGPDNQPLRYTPHDFRRLFLTDALRSGLPPHIAAKIAGHQQVDTTLGYAAIYPEDVINHHRAFIARRRSLRPSQEYRELTGQEWDEFLAHFELRKVALGTCARDHGTACQHENACIRCPLLRPDPAQQPRLEEIRANLLDRLQEAKEQGWLGEVAAIEASLAAADQKLESMQTLAVKHTRTHLGMPDFHHSAGRSSRLDS